MSDVVAVLDDAPPAIRRKGRPAAADPSPTYDPWILQLAPLASQHHLSEYSRIKYGHQGCPVLYTPLSLHLPDVVHGLRERQQKYADQILWWPCTPANTESSPIIPAAEQRAALASGETILLPELRQELSIALSESIPVQSSHQDRTSSCLSHIKTSESHPINISQIIPPESLIAISSHLTPCKRPCPVLFEIHFPYVLDRLTGYPQLSPSRADHPPILPIRSGSIPLAVSPRKYLPRSSVTGVFNAALNTKFSLPPLPSSRILLSLRRNLKIHTSSDGASQTHVVDTISELESCRSTSSSTIPQSSQNRPPSMLPLPTPYALHPFSAHIRPPTAPSPPDKIFRFRASEPSSTAPPRQGSSNPRPFKLGNLLLSSCPGKKVRLSGPVRGRSAVYRDLDVDMRRMKMLGARCVVCCLDDEELEFLIGVSWIEYCQVAHQEGLDVLRIPLPEGLTPLSPKSLDADLDRITERYTLQGVSVLVHCRGGVGRAGLFACCWMLKLGLCGWIETDNIPASAATISGADSEIKRDDIPPETFRWDSETVVRRDTLQLVEQVIEVVRRRRSVKAIETLEQVQFLVEYVDYLRTCGCVGGDSTHS